MSSDCPTAPASSSTLAVQTTELPIGSVLFRFHGSIYKANSFNPNTGKRMDLPEAGSRFNPFPGELTANIPTLYAADTLKSAALESVFHDLEHTPSPTYPRSRLVDWHYSKLMTKRKLVVLRLVNAQLRQLSSPGRVESVTESELIHTPASEYPHTRTWAKFLHDSISTIDGLAWRPRLGGTGWAYVFFGDRFEEEDLAVDSKPTPVAAGPGLAKIHTIARLSNISIVDP